MSAPSSENELRLKAEAEAYEGLLKLAMDDMRRIYEDLLKTHSQLTQSDKLATIGLLSAGVIHEINNPLFAIQGIFLLLKENLAGIQQSLRGQGISVAETQPLFEEVKTSLDQGAECVEHISKIVKDIRVFSRTDKGQKVSENVNVVLDGVIGIAWNAIKNKAELKKVYGDLPKINCNPQALGQVFLNLLVNASQAITGHGVITVKTYLQGAFVQVEISDTGGGIPEEIRDKIFDPFFTTKDSNQGTGLGLGICADIIKKHSGTIGVESEVGRGTTFIVSLPAEGL